MTTGGDTEMAAWPAAEDALIARMSADLRRNNEYQFAKSRKRRAVAPRQPHTVRDAHAESCAEN
ncbi:hypothetical protein C6A87_018605 [Mycobacterium sp. ITM-2016-00317]|uniref:hypothetical protein n=1 Tax=Mycobacterium sp. ITM-2016-00317 TaxID=2099694 RepID=UPI00287FCFEE|nr:hypothetical protein [Mycobacterium sp. ITM-2016-00317]WNG85922.1 hypothetical protein C6A87_018605 [Mycobacterium sp. ITM-2016-00317]